jgi:plastocyanin
MLWLKSFLKFKVLNLAVIGVLLSSVLLVACGDTPTSQPAATTAAGTGATTAAGSSATTSAAGQVQTINIDIASFKFSPAEINVPAGSTVIWTNKDAAKHNVIADDRSFESPTLEKGGTFSRKFDTPGTIGYFCSLHGSAGQGMIGKIVVTPAVAGAQTQPAQAAATTAAQAPTTQIPAIGAAPTALAGAVGNAANTIRGTVSFRDDLQLNDQVVINLENIGVPPAGRVYWGWLTGTGGNLSLGQLAAGADGKVTRRFTEPKNANLIALYDSFKVTTETLDPSPTAPSANVVYSNTLPEASLVHIRHLMVSIAFTPNKIGLETGLRAQTQEMRRHAEFLRDAAASGQLPAVKQHAEHIVNLIEGTKGSNYGDLDKNGAVENPGDGFGLLKNGDQLGYLEGSKSHADLAAKAPGATEEIKLHAGHVAITVDNATGWLTTTRDKALAVLKVTEIKQAEPLVREILALSNQSLNGVDLKGDGQILPIPGSGGVLTSYQHAQLMANFVIAGSTDKPAAATAPGNATAKATETAHNHGSPATTAAATGAGNAAAQNGEVKLNISQFKFGDGNPLTIKKGTKVTWTNQDTAPHTATADNNSWDSGTLQKGQSFSFVFDKAGTVKYHCEVHPNMTHTIIVVD